MTEKKQFYKEEVTPYRSLFVKYKKFCNKVAKQEGVYMTEIAEVWRARTNIGWRDRLFLLLKSYGQQLPVKSKLNNPAALTSEEEVMQELEVLNLQMSQTQFMYLCQLTAIYQQPESSNTPVGQ